MASRRIDPGRVGLIQDSQPWEVLPRQSRLAGWASANIRCHKSPCPRLRNSNLKPNGHREETGELTEDHLLPGLRGDRLQQQRACLSGIKVFQEPVYTRFTKASELLTEVQKLQHRIERIDVRALLRSASAQDIAKHSGMSNLLLSHELNQITVFSCKPSSNKVLVREALEAVMEQVKLNPFPVQCERLQNRLASWLSLNAD